MSGFGSKKSGKQLIKQWFKTHPYFYEYNEGAKTDIINNQDGFSVPDNILEYMEWIEYRYQADKIGKKGSAFITSDAYIQGYWSLSVEKDDFTIGCQVGRGFRFDANTIEHRITQKCGRDTYQTWKQLVKQDIDSLKHLVKQARKNTKKLVPSVCINERSENLCRQVGLPVVKGYTFLLPEGYEMDL